MSNKWCEWENIKSQLHTTHFSSVQLMLRLALIGVLLSNIRWYNSPTATHTLWARTKKKICLTRSHPTLCSCLLTAQFALFDLRSGCLGGDYLTRLLPVSEICFFFKNFARISKRLTAVCLNGDFWPGCVVFKEELIDYSAVCSNVVTRHFPQISYRIRSRMRHIMVAL